MGKEKKKEALHIPTMIFCIVGLVLTILGILLLKNQNFKLNVISTQGTVIGVQTKTTAEGTVESRSVNLSYIANNGSYDATIRNYPEDIEIGEKMTLYYDFFSPASVSDKRTGYQAYLATIIGLILILKTGPRFVRIIKDNYL